MTVSDRRFSYEDCVVFKAMTDPERESDLLLRFEEPRNVPEYVDFYLGLHSCESFFQHESIRLAFDSKHAGEEESAVWQVFFNDFSRLLHGPNGASLSRVKHLIIWARIIDKGTLADFLKLAVTTLGLERLTIHTDEGIHVEVLLEVLESPSKTLQKLSLSCEWFVLPEHDNKTEIVQALLLRMNSLQSLRLYCYDGKDEFLGELLSSFPINQHIWELEVVPRSGVLIPLARMLREEGNKLLKLTLTEEIEIEDEFAHLCNALQACNLQFLDVGSRMDVAMAEELTKACKSPGCEIRFLQLHWLFPDAQSFRSTWIRDLLLGSKITHLGLTWYTNVLKHLQIALDARCKIQHVQFYYDNDHDNLDPVIEKKFLNFLKQHPLLPLESLEFHRKWGKEEFGSLRKGWKKILQLNKLLREHGERFPSPLGLSLFNEPQGDNSVSLLGKLEKIEDLGHGHYGTVVKVKDTSTGTYYAVKKVRFGNDNVIDLEREVTLLRICHHQNIIRYLGTEKVGKKLHIYMELAEHGSLRSLLNNGLRVEDIRNYTRQILRGLKYLHSRKVIHRDIKCANILLDNGIVKLGDFGLVKQLETATLTSTERKGTAHWMAPEVMHPEKKVGCSADIWSLGCTVYEMATGKPPLSDLNKLQLMYRLVHIKEVPSIPDALDKDMREFISVCLQYDPSKRPSATELLGHSFVNPRAGEMFRNNQFPEKFGSLSWKKILQQNKELREHEERFPSPMGLSLFNEPQGDNSVSLVGNLEKVANLGSGSFGTVVKVKDTSTGMYYAVKKVRFGLNNLIDLEREVALLRICHHRNIIQYLGTEKVGNKLHIYMELAEHGSLRSLLNNGLSVEQTQNYTRQILHGLKYLHSRKVIHRNIKCANILLNNGIVKLGDFGLAKQLETATLTSTVTKGTIHWMAPEVMHPDGKVGCSADIWSLGCTVYEMATGKPPLSDLNKLQLMYRLVKEAPFIPHGLDEDMRDFISVCLQYDPSKRPSATELLGHPFVNPRAGKTFELYA